jgi:hypothetical protein
MKMDDFGFDGACEPTFGDLPSYSIISEKFPTYYFMKKFY